MRAIRNIRHRQNRHEESSMTADDIAVRLTGRHLNGTFAGPLAHNVPTSARPRTHERTLPARLEPTVSPWVQRATGRTYRPDLTAERWDDER